MTEIISNHIASKEITSGSGVTYASDPEAFSSFEDLYLKVREKEGRVYPNSIVKKLPDVERSHPLHREWQIRSKSLKKLEAYLTQKPKPMTILDLGCGNGWMANRLAQIHQCRVYAVDLNRTELEQGARLFANTASMHFIYGNIFEDIFPESSFDTILLISSVQYFSDIRKLINRLLELLNEAGEIHILDSPFYTEESALAAKQRTIKYYEQLGFPGMADHYFQHRWVDLTEFDYQIMYDPNNYLNRFRRRFLKRTASPFPWIVIQH